MEPWLEASIVAHQIAGVETVLSTDKYRRLVRLAQSNDFLVKVLFVYLPDASLNVERVRIRTTKGDHHVPEDKIRSRWVRSFDNFASFLREADEVDAIDNSLAERQLVLVKRGDRLSRYGRLPQSLRDAMAAAYPGAV